MNNIFWGTLLLLLGISIIVKAILGLSIPIFRPLFGLFLIYMGIQFIIGHTHWYMQVKNSKEIILCKEDTINAYIIAPSYSVVCSKGSVDLSTAATPTTLTQTHITTVCAETTLILNSAIPTRLQINTVLGSTEIPSNGLIWLGNQEYATTKNSNEIVLNVKCDVVMGSLKIKML